MSKFYNLLESWITVSSPDPDDARARRNLNILIFGLGVLLILAILVSLLILTDTRAEGSNLLTIVGSALMLIGMGIIYFINRYWSGVFSANLFLILLIAVISFSDTPEQLSGGRSLFVFMIPIAMASLILRPSAAFFFALLGSATIAGFSFSLGKIPNFPAILGYFLVAFISWMSSSSLESALNNLRVINANLDGLVTERTQELAEALTRERIEAGRNQAILNSIADGVIVFNAENSSILANPALSDLIKTPSEDLTAISLNEFVQTADLSGTSQKMIRELIEQPERSESGVRVEWGKKSLSVGVARVQDTATRENIGAVAVFRDVTREAELEKMKENFVAVVSHELRTPLNALMGLTEMLQEGIYGAMNEKQVSITERLMTNITRLLSMVGDLLDEAQIGAGKLSINPQVFKTASLLENLHSTMDKIAIDKGLALSSNLDPSLPQNIVGDHQRLQQILVNLVTNAIKFTEKGGVHVSILREEQDHWKIEVTDTGIGIAETEVPYIFETFRQASNTAMRTRQHGGFGLGLSIVKQLVELMNGRITVASQTEQGSTFTVLLPLETAQY
jgi:signal transduction histidine kinase